LVTTALAAFVNEQSRDGLWDKAQPIYNYKSLSGGKGQSIENAFVFPVNTLGSLLCSLPAKDFRLHLDALELEKTLKWIEDHQTTEIHTNYCDSDVNCYGVPLRGWTSSHLEAGPEAWPTAQVLKCVS
jgi:hypothetical protein